MLGIFDSGSGGLTVMRSLVDVFPDMSMMYLGDHVRAPYGDRSLEEIRQFTGEAIDWLFAHGCEQVLLACNTASAATRGTLGDSPVISIIEPTLEWLKDQNKEEVGLLATTATVRSGVFTDMVAHQHSCPAWALFIERGNPKSDGAREVVARDVRALITGRDLKTVVLACTHYPYFHDLLVEILSKDVHVVDQGAIVADWLVQNSLLRSVEDKRLLQFFTTEDPVEISRRAADFFGSPVTFQKADF